MQEKNKLHPFSGTRRTTQYLFPCNISITHFKRPVFATKKLCRQKKLYTSTGKGETRASKSPKSPPPLRSIIESASGDMKGYWKHSAPKLACEKYFCFQLRASGNKFVDTLYRMGVHVCEVA
eukprot:1139420-Pelagomonas_calceolata.AAC.3